jgi:Tol biopolymer transport system component
MTRGLVAVVVTGICLVGAGQARAVFAGENGRIVYATRGDESNPYSVHTILPNGQGDAVIRRSPGSHFAWSPNGRRIAFDWSRTSKRQLDIYAIRADGANVRRLTWNINNKGPRYSPGGGRIAYSHVELTNWSVMTVPSDGLGDRSVLGPGVVRAWTPKRQIAYMCRSDDLCVMRPDGSDRRELVSLGKRGGLGPFYSPNGHRLLFTRRGAGGSQTVLMADGDGSDVRQPPCPRFFERFVPVTYSPDGRWVLGGAPLSRDTQTPTNYKLTRVSLATCQAHRVVSPTATPASADWQALP